MLLCISTCPSPWKFLGDFIFGIVWIRRSIKSKEKLRCNACNIEFVKSYGREHVSKKALPTGVT